MTEVPPLRQISIQAKCALPQRREWTSKVDHPDEGDSKSRAIFLRAAGIVLGLLLITFYGEVSKMDLGPILRGITNFGFALFGSVIVAGIFRRAKRHDSSSRFYSDSRPPILLLRAFDDEAFLLEHYEVSYTLALGQSVPRRFEELLCEIFSKIGPPIAIARPEENLPPIGAARYWVKDRIDINAWKHVVNEIINDSQYVLIIMGRMTMDDKETGLGWEASQMLSEQNLSKAIFIMPPVEDQEARRRWQEYREISQNLFPEYVGGEVAIMFNSNRTHQVFRLRDTSRHRDYYSYQSAFDVK